MFNVYDEKRKKFRVPCFHDCYYYVINKGEHKKHKFNLKNISVTGACIETRSKLENEEVIKIHICRDFEMFFTAQVIWRRSNTYGISLILESNEDLKNISYVLNNIKLNEKSS